jgi:anti-sigma factor (TIGR02949 family)
MNSSGFGRLVPEPYDPFGNVDLSLTGDCNTMISRLYHFLDGELTEERRTKIQRHLDACPSCYGAYDFEAELRMVVASKAQVQVPEELRRKIQISIQACSTTPSPDPTRPTEA